MNSTQKIKNRKLKQAVKNASIEKLTALKMETYFKKVKEIKEDNLYPHVISSVERALISCVLKRTSFNQIKCAKVLGINRNTLRRKIKELKIKLQENTQN